MAYINIDAHQHFWKFDPVRDNWITDDMQVLKRDFLPVHLEPILKEFHFSGSVVVQSDQSEKENEFQLSNAEQYPFIKGVVGWVNLHAADIEDRLAYYKSFNKLKGFRHILQGELQRDFMLNPAFKNGISRLKKFGFTYDLLILPDQLEFAKMLVAAYPDQPFVIDHIAKPFIKDKKTTAWKKAIQEIALHKNVWCKISGLVTEADLQNWKTEDFAPYINVIVEAFGTDRIMFGSDWPVCLLAANYGEIKNIVDDYFLSFSLTEQEAFFGGNAINFYKL